MRIWIPISYRGGNQTRTGAPTRPQCPRPARPENHHHHFRLIPSELSTLASSCVRIICIHHHHFRLIPSELYTLANSCVRIICIWIGHDSTTVRFWGSGSSRAEPGPPSAGFCAIPSEARSDRRLIALSGGLLSFSCRFLSFSFCFRFKMKVKRKVNDRTWKASHPKWAEANAKWKEMKTKCTEKNKK